MTAFVTRIPVLVLIIKHLIKFSEYINGEWRYRFASHPRFAYWAFNMVQRHRLLSQGSIFLEQNPFNARLTTEQPQQMLHWKTYTKLMSKLMHYAKNVSGSSSYWHKAKEDLRATLCHVLSIIGLNFIIALVILNLATFRQISGKYQAATCSTKSKHFRLAFC